MSLQDYPNGTHGYIDNGGADPENPMKQIGKPLLIVEEMKLGLDDLLQYFRNLLQKPMDHDEHEKSAI